MASKIDIFNMALAHIGTTVTVADEAEKTVERITCSRFYDTCRDALLAYKSCDWNFAMTSVLLADIGSPPTNWLYRYRYPSDCIRAVGLVIKGNRSPTEAQKLRFDVMYEAAGRSIVSDQTEAELLYITRVTEAERYPSSFVEALALRLAAFIAMPLNKDKSLRDELTQRSEQAIQIAMAYTLNEEQPDNPPESDYTTEMHA